jgi:hypothetical protein
VLGGVPLNGLAIEIDGKAKLLRNGWKLVSAGTRSLKVTKGGKKIVHSYRPWVFAVCKAESTVGVAEIISCLRETALMLWKIPLEGPGSLRFCCGSSDRYICLIYA